MRDVVHAPAVHRKGLGSDEARLGRNQKGHRVGDILGKTGPLDHGSGGHAHQVDSLPSGLVLVQGGVPTETFGAPLLARAELYTPPPAKWLIFMLATPCCRWTVACVATPQRMGLKRSVPIPKPGPTSSPAVR